MEREVPSADGLVGEVDAIEAEVARARLSFEQGLREASLVGTRAARRVVTPALIGIGLAGGALLLLALVRLARRPSDGALIRVVVETPRSPKRILPAVGGTVLRWLLEKQLRGRGPLGVFVEALTDRRVGHEGNSRITTARSVGHYDS
jgi:hypothetical protein